MVSAAVASGTPAVVRRYGRCHVFAAVVTLPRFDLCHLGSEDLVLDRFRFGVRQFLDRFFQDFGQPYGPG
ncbi:hypothetical protein [Nocardia grenadensis]